MKELKKLSQIKMPVIKSDLLYKCTVLGRVFKFNGLKTLLGKCDYPKSGDLGAQIGAEDNLEREAARKILSELTLEHLYQNPLSDANGLADNVMRVNYDINLADFSRISDLTVGQFRDYLLEASSEMLKEVSGAITGVMAAAVTKICTPIDMTCIAQKINKQTKAITVLGRPGTLSSRLQPNHPTDNLDGITTLCYLGLSKACGDALIGLNPAVGTVDSVSAVLERLKLIRDTLEVPTPICVLSHIKTQMEALAKGAPVEIAFQSLAGTQSTLNAFGVTVAYLDDAYHKMIKQSPLSGIAKQFMYFETGQGSEYSYGLHNGIDMATCEALTYGLARRYDPYMVNNVTGFIGPETHKDDMEMILSSLQDHFMGKLLGLPMGMGPCYTLHSKITHEGQQLATLLLAAAQTNYFIDVYLGTDRMLAYFDTSGHDNQSLREIYRRQTTPEFTEWCFKRQILQPDEYGRAVRGPNWGHPDIFCSSRAEYKYLSRSTPSLFQEDNAGSRPINDVCRKVLRNQAIGKSATYKELRLDLKKLESEIIEVQTLADSKEKYLSFPDLGAGLDEVNLARIPQHNEPVQIVVSDGLSAEAIHHNIYTVLPIVQEGLRAKGIGGGRVIVARYGRVKLAQPIAQKTKCSLVVLLIGERPGGDELSSRSMSAYFCYQLSDSESLNKARKFSGNPDLLFEYSVISNIYSDWLPPLEAGSVILEKVDNILKFKAAGNSLEQLLIH